MGKDKISSQVVSVTKGSKSVKTSLQCPNCSKKFEYETETITLTELDEDGCMPIKAQCPHCGIGLSGTIKKQLYQCVYCPRKFENQEDMVEHQNKCVLKNTA